MRHLVTATFVSMLAVTGTSPTSVSAQGSDPASVVAAFDAALNAGNLEATLALFADDAVVRTQTATYTGQEKLRRLFQEPVADRFQFESSNRRVVGDTETHAAKVSRDEWRRLGIAPLEASAEVVVQPGKIRFFAVTYTAESLARLQAPMLGWRRRKSRAPCHGPGSRLPQPAQWRRWLSWPCWPD